MRAALVAMGVASISFSVSLNCYGQTASANMQKRVAGLIQQMLSEKTEHRAFAELESLGCPAVPEIIEQMDDRRNLPDASISLANKSSDAFEGLRHYRPQKVVDALAAILNQVTGQDFGFIYNGATEKERANAVRAWRNFVRKTPPAKLCEAG